jgi:hypothetical protein
MHRIQKKKKRKSGVWLALQDDGAEEGSWCTVLSHFEIVFSHTAKRGHFPARTGSSCRVGLHAAFHFSTVWIDIYVVYIERVWFAEDLFIRYCSDLNGKSFKVYWSAKVKDSFSEGCWLFAIRNLWIMPYIKDIL